MRDSWQSISINKQTKKPLGLDSKVNYSNISMRARCPQNHLEQKNTQKLCIDPCIIALSDTVAFKKHEEAERDHELAWNSTLVQLYPKDWFSLGFV